MGQSQSLSIMTAIAITLCIAIATANSNDENEEGLVQLGINGQQQGVDQEYFYRALLEDQVHEVEIDQEGNVVRRLGQNIRAEHLASTPPYSEETAIELAKYAFAAYCEPANIKAWSCRWCTGSHAGQNYGAPHSAPPALDHHEIRVFTSDNHRAYTGWNQKDKRIMVVVRGTDTKEEMFNDMEAAQTTFDAVSQTGAQVHSGFMYVWTRLRDGMLPAISALVKAHPRSPIYLTGHSLGGAVVQLAALEVRNAHPEAQIIVYTFGSPRVGDKKFVAAFNDAISQNGGVCYRVMWGADSVPQHPTHGDALYKLKNPLKAFSQIYFHTPQAIVYENPPPTGQGWRHWKHCGIHDAQNNCLWYGAGGKISNFLKKNNIISWYAAYVQYHHHYFNLLPAGQDHMCRDNKQD